MVTQLEKAITITLDLLKYNKPKELIAAELEQAGLSFGDVFEKQIWPKAYASFSKLNDISKDFTIGQHNVIYINTVHELLTKVVPAEDPVVEKMTYTYNYNQALKILKQKEKVLGLRTKKFRLRMTEMLPEMNSKGLDQILAEKIGTLALEEQLELLDYLDIMSGNKKESKKALDTGTVIFTEEELLLNASQEDKMSLIDKTVIEQPKDVNNVKYGKSAQQVLDKLNKVSAFNN